MHCINAYYQILGVSEKAGLEDIKRAYRKKALLLHPDRNPSSNANEEFVLLVEAYDFLSKLKTGKIYIPKTTPGGQQAPSPASPRTRPQTAQTHYANWQEPQRAEARRRAAEYAKMQYEEFLHSDYYKNFDSFHTVFTYFYVAFGFAVIIGIPLMCAVYNGWPGLILGILIMGVPVAAGYGFFKEIIKNLSFREFAYSLRRLSHTKSFIAVCLSLLNIIFFLKIGLQTFIAPTLLVTAYVASMLLGYVILYLLFKPLKKSVRLFYSIFGAPCLISFLLLINFILSSHPVQETYSFRNKWGRTPNIYDENSVIQLEGNQYADYPGIRIFSNFDLMVSKKHIVYTFKDGLLGFRVMTNFKFTD